MIIYEDEVSHSNKNRIVRVRSFPGATTEDILDHCKSVARKKPDIIILHVETSPGQTIPTFHATTCNICCEEKVCTV